MEKGIRKNMKITICGSINFTYEMKKYADELMAASHSVELPMTSRRILSGELTLEEFRQEKENNGDGSFRKIRDDVIKRYYEIIRESDAILVVNARKNNIDNYIGGNTFLEIGFAHVLGKKIYLLNPIPDMIYTDEIKAMQPTVIDNDLNKIVG